MTRLVASAAVTVAGRPPSKTSLSFGVDAKPCPRTVAGSPSTSTAGSTPAIHTDPGSRTDTASICVALRPPPSVAIAVTSASPAPTAITVTTVPDTATEATPAFDDTAVYVSASPSGSLKAPDTSTVRDSPTIRSRPGSVPVGAGARLGTFTAKLCSALRPPPSIAVTVMTALPCDTAATVTTLPATETVTTATSVEDAV